jgi:hypothetical protein
MLYLMIQRLCRRWDRLDPLARLRIVIAAWYAGIALVCVIAVLRRELLQ